MKRINSAVWIEKYKRWQIKVQKDGIRKTFYSSVVGRNGQRECNRKADDWLDDNIVDSRKKVAEMAVLYISDLTLTTSRSHYEQYQSFFKNWINPKIGFIRIENLTEYYLQSVINNGYSKGLSRKTLKDIKTCLSSFLKFCRLCKASTLYPENLSIPTSAAISKKAILQPDDIKKLFLIDMTVEKGKSVYELFINAYRFAVLTGMRPGEILGLMWSDIENGVVSLKRSFNRYKEFTNGKNNNAARSFRLIPYAVELLECQAKKLEELKIDSEYVFPDKHGDVANQGNYYKHWRRYCDSVGMTSRVTPYELRHTFVSVVKSLPEGYLKQLVGHSQNMDTYGVYSHEVIDDKKVIADMTQEIFNSILNDKQ